MFNLLEQIAEWGRAVVSTAPAIMLGCRVFHEGKNPMALTAEEIFTRDVRDLPSSERLRLAALILQDLTRSGATVVEQSESWSDQDRQDLTAFSLEHASQIYPEEEDLV